MDASDYEIVKTIVDNGFPNAISIKNHERRSVYGDFKIFYYGQNRCDSVL